MNVWTKPMESRLRAEYGTCKSVSELAESIGVTPSQAYGKARKLRIHRANESRIESLRAAAAEFAARQPAAPQKSESRGIVAIALSARTALEVAWSAPHA